ncbi:MAG: peptidase MA family metallohydrolase [Dehalococcoidia bacterium]
MMRRFVLIALAPLLLVVSAPVAADTGISLIASSVEIAFPTRAVFTLAAESYVDIVDVRLHYRVDKMNYAEVVSEGWASFARAGSVQATWTWDMRQAGLPPGAEVEYWWAVKDADGNRLETPSQVMRFDDDRFVWRNLASVTPEGNELTLFWYQGSDSFARELLNACEEGLARLTVDIGAYPERPIRIYVYASASDLLGAMIFPYEWTGGVAFPEFSTIAIGISPTSSIWGKRALVHELTHLVVHQATYGPYGQLPIWLDEGLAMYNEGELESGFRSRLQQAIQEDDLISVRSLCSEFSADTQTAYLSYAESYSLVEYLLDEYGEEKMLALLTLLQQGTTYDQALTDVYGFDIEGLDARWRATLIPDAVIVAEAGRSLAASAVVWAVLAAAVVLSGALVLRKRARPKFPPWVPPGK